VGVTPPNKFPCPHTGFLRKFINESTQDSGQPCPESYLPFSVGAKVSATNTDAPRNPPYVAGVGHAVRPSWLKSKVTNTPVLVPVGPLEGAPRQTGNPRKRGGVPSDSFRLVSGMI